mgnify:CR=1 FL=1
MLAGIQKPAKRDARREAVSTLEAVALLMAHLEASLRQTTYLQDDTVTIRDRDTLQQVRVKMSDVKGEIEKALMPQ